MRRLFVIATAIVLALAVGTVAWASIPAADGTINGCRKNTDGSLRVVDSGASCPSGYTALNWSQTGPQGAAGSSGYERVIRTVHLNYTTNSDTRFVTGTCPTGKQAVNAGLISLSADQAWVDGVASGNFSGPPQNGSATVGNQTATNGAPEDPNFLRNPVPVTSGQTAAATGWTLVINVANWPVWNGNAYGMDVNFWLACEIPS